MRLSAGIGAQSRGLGRGKLTLCWVPQARVPYSSGAADTAGEEPLELFGGAATLSWPFTPEAASASSALVLQRVKRLVRVATDAVQGPGS